MGCAQNVSTGVPSAGKVAGSALEEKLRKKERERETERDRETERERKKGKLHFTMSPSMLSGKNVR